VYTDELRKELFKKIKDWAEVNQKICRIENEASGMSFDDLIESHEEYGELCFRAEELRNEIESVMIGTKYFPLFGLGSKQKEVLDIFAEAKSLDHDKNIEKHLDLHLIGLQEDVKRRLAEVKPLYLTTAINPNSRIYRFYNEAIRCYIYGAFEASSVLCRAICETIAKRYIENTKYKDFLYGKQKTDESAPSIGKILKKLSINKNAVDLYYRIGSNADEILHSKNEKTAEKEACKTISHLQSFIKEFYQEQDFSAEWI